MASHILTATVRFSRSQILFRNNVLQFAFNKKGFYSFHPKHFSSTSIMAGKYLKNSVRDEVGVITFDSPEKVNSLNKGVIDEFITIFRSFRDDPQVKAIVLRSSKPDNFIAGADINMLKACKSSAEAEGLAREGQSLLQEVEDSPKPVVCAIMGSCLGGGLEVALATHYRIATSSKKTQLGFPEVQLGLLPGSGGTQRSVNLVPLDQALDLILTGKQVDAMKAKKLGLVDQVISPIGPGLHHPNENTLLYLEDIAIETARNLASGKLKRMQRKKGLVEGITNYLLRYERPRNFFFKKVMDKVMKASKGLYPAPLKIVEVMEESLVKGKSFGYDMEAKAFGQLAATDQSKALIGLFDGMTACKKNRFGTPHVPVKRLGVLGAGLMGAGIAQVSIDKQLTTVIKDTTMTGLARGQQQIEKGLMNGVKRKKFSQQESDRIYSNLIPTLTYDEFKDVDMVVEAVFEDVKVKHSVIKELEEHIHENCVIATNTSAISIAKVAEASKRPEKVVGMHYFSPVDKMMLLEIVTFDKTSKDTIASAVDVGLKQGKVVIAVKDSPGFYTTRCLMAFANEVVELLFEGMDPKELDKRTIQMGFPVGSATLLDEVGVDVSAHINNYLANALADRIVTNPNEGAVLSQMVAKGYLGRKSGKGIFLYEGDSKDRQVNPGFREIIKPYVGEPKLPLTTEDVRLRILTRFTDQSILCLQESVLANPLEGDIGAVFGLGFPPFLGGPFRFADIYGVRKLYDEMKRMEEAYGPRFKPCQLLEDHAKNNKKFHSDGKISDQKMETQRKAATL